MTSLCETSLNDEFKIPDNILNDSTFCGCNYPFGKKNGGVGIFYKSPLPLKIRNGLSFGDCIVPKPLSHS